MEEELSKIIVTLVPFTKYKVIFKLDTGRVRASGSLEFERNKFFTLEEDINNSLCKKFKFTLQQLSQIDVTIKDCYGIQ